jgi:hypothetical protein
LVGNSSTGTAVDASTLCPVSSPAPISPGVGIGVPHPETKKAAIIRLAISDRIGIEFVLKFLIYPRLASSSGSREGQDYKLPAFIAALSKITVNRTLIFMKGTVVKTHKTTPHEAGIKS